LSNLLQQSYNNYAIKRDNSEIEPWKIWERKQFLYRLYQEDFKTLLEIGSGPGKL